jgi:hypothetical protein
MDFASVSTLGDTIFSTTDSGLNWLYSASLITVCVASIVFTGIMQRWKRGGNWAVMGMGVVGNVAGGWTRWYSVRQGSYAIAMASSVLLGVAGAAIIVSIVPLAKHNFSVAQRTLATTIAVQLNYAGWCIASVVIPTFSSTEHDLEHLMFLQAVIISAGLPLFLFFHRPQPAAAAAAAAKLKCCGGSADPAATALRNGGKKIGTYSILDDEIPGSYNVEEEDDDDDRAAEDGAGEGSPWGLLANCNFVVQSLAFAMLGGISFAIPAVQDEIFNELGLDQDITKWTNLAFLASGVVSGLSLGAIFHRFGIQPTSPTSMQVLRVLFSVCTVALAMLAVVSYSATGGAVNKGITIVIFIAMMVSGACSLGFVGVALSQAVAVAHPVSEIYSASFVEWFLQIWGVVFAQLCAGTGGGSTGPAAPAPGPNATASEYWMEGDGADAEQQPHTLGFVILASGCLVATLGLFCSSSSNTMRLAPVTSY